MQDLSQYLDVFLEELEEQLQAMEQEILSLENEGRSEAGIQRLFRAAHTLKGSSAAMGFGKLKTLTHELEHILDKIRSHECAVTPEIIQVFLSCFDRMKLLQSEIVKEREERSDISDLVDRLRRIERDAAPEERSESRIALSAETLAELGREIESDPAIELLTVRVRLTDESIMRQARLGVIDLKMASFGKLHWRDHDPRLELEDEQLRQTQWIVSTRRPQDEIKGILQALMDVRDVAIEPIDLRLFESGEPSSDSRVPSESTNAALPPQARTEPVDRYKANTIRVQVDRIEQLMNHVGELVIEQARIQQAEKALRRRFGADDTLEGLANIADHLNRIVSEVQESVMKVRMLPIEQLFNRFPRMVRDLARSLHKEVELAIEGKETELDRTLIEEIGDPLIHLIRNAIDHGIESPAERKKVGKPERGTLRIQAAHEDNQIIITVRDDGKGIDPEQIRGAAIAKGILTEEQASAMSEQEAIRLIFHSGFSTAKQLSEISGRGVGMDIVRTDIERLNGLIDIETSLGEGTAFKVRLPLTLAIITGLLVDIGNRIFVLPMSNVVEIVRTETTELKTVQGSPVISIRNQIIPVIWLHDYFGYPRTRRSGKHVPLIIVGRAEKRLAIAVDELLGNQEVVIKSLGEFVGRPDGIAGATILGNGNVALILEISGIMKMASTY